MWKYIGTKECNEFLLSLNLINCKDEKKYIKLKNKMVNIELYMNQIQF